MWLTLFIFGLILSIIVLISKSTLFYGEVKNIKEWKENAAIVIPGIIFCSYFFFILALFFSIFLSIGSLPFNGFDFKGIWDDFTKIFWVLSCKILLLIGMPLSMTTVNSYIKLKLLDAKIKKKIRLASQEIKKSNQSIVLDIEKLEELRSKVSSRKEVESTYNLCILINDLIENKEIFEECLNNAKLQLNILNQINNIEEKIVKFSEQYRIAGNDKEAEKYLKIANNIK